MKKLALTDFAKYRYPSALELSPDSRYLTFALKEVDREGDGYHLLCQPNVFVLITHLKTFVTVAGGGHKSQIFRSRTAKRQFFFLGVLVHFVAVPLLFAHLDTA